MSFFTPLIREHFVSRASKVGPAPTAMSGRPPKIELHLNENTITRNWQHAKYPAPQDPRILSRLSDLYGVPSEQIILTPGGDAGISSLTQLMCDAGDAVLVHSPTFFSYTNYANLYEAAVIDVPLIEGANDFELDTKGIIDQINEAKDKLKIVYICSPNNPTGSSFNENHIHDILKAAEAKHIAVVVDEAYIEIAGNTSILEKNDEHPNLIVIRTLSKAYSMAGARVGALICNDPGFSHIAKTVFQPMFATPTPSIDAALKMLDPAKNDAIKTSWQTIRDQREILRNSIAETKHMRAFRSDTNFLLVGVENAKDVFEHFKDQAIAINNPTLFGFTDKLRMSLGTTQENERIAEAIHAIDRSL